MPLGAHRASLRPGATLFISLPLQKGAQRGDKILLALHVGQMHHRQHQQFGCREGTGQQLTMRSAVTGLVWLPNWLSARYLRSGNWCLYSAKFACCPVKSTPSGLTAVIYRPKRGRRSTSCWHRCQASCQGTKGGVCARENPSSRAAGCTVCGILVSACHKGSGTRHTAF